MSGHLVFTDLDGSLLDHHSYQFDEARPMLRRLDELAVPVIPTSSKTRVEIEALRRLMDNVHPFIVENGAAIYIPKGYFDEPPSDTVDAGAYRVKTFSPGRDHWLSLLAELESEFSGEFQSFAQLGSSGIAVLTGLSPEDAEDANTRDFSEPIHWQGSEHRREEFVAALVARDANPLQGGRFLTLSGDCDKGRALCWLRQVYAGRPGKAVGQRGMRDLAIGDSGNDVAMLEAAQTALVVRSPVHDYPKLNTTGDVIYSTEYGPAGWAQGVSQWLQATGLDASS